MELIQNHSVMEAFFKQWRSPLGEDFDRYRNHCYRVVNHCQLLTQLKKDELEQVMIAACFHDVGIWLDNTFDYLKPSQDRANNYLVREGKSHWSQVVCGMIMEHHKITAYEGEQENIINAFRKADWIDVTMGSLSYGASRGKISDIRKAFPYLGFHTRLVQLSAKNLIQNPFNPLPMFKL
ncbi:MAG: HD domain-containing protein [Pseudomonadales bacterium]|nr:HD domain-containing protein [Pseudomonadales bacterium]